ncbi:MAG: His/Gly/Thr/Pro-type tRNA ligase C-terminal domain-containing protein, partial [Planctomycetota bacterium]
FRVGIDADSGKIGGKIAQAQQDRVPYMLVVGGKDEAAGTVSVRHRDRGEQGAVALDEFVADVVQERDERRLA